MDSNNRKIINSDMITISELGILFLEAKYNNISMLGYGTYQTRIRIINEYFGNTMLNCISEYDIKEFEKYLMKRKKWKYKDELSNYSVKMIITTLREMLNRAIKWNLIKTISLEKNTNTILSSDESRIKSIDRLLIKLEQKRVLNEMDKIFK